MPKILFCTDFDGTVTKREGGLTVFSDFYQSLLVKPKDHKDGTQIPYKNCALADDIQDKFIKKFGVTPNYSLRDANMLMSPEAVAFFHKALSNKSVTINISTKNRADYIKALFTYHGFTPEEISKLIIHDSGFKGQEVWKLLLTHKVDHIYILDDSKDDYDIMVQAAISSGYSKEQISSYNQAVGEFQWATYQHEISTKSAATDNAENSMDLIRNKITTWFPGTPTNVFQFNLNREKADDFLRANPTVPFIIRKSSRENHFVIDFISEGRNQHFLMAPPETKKGELILVDDKGGNQRLLSDLITEYTGSAPKTTTVISSPSPLQAQEQEIQQPNKHFSKENALYSIISESKSSEGVLKKTLFNELVEKIKGSPAFRDPYSKVIIESDRIYFGHSLDEITASFPFVSDLAHKGTLTEKQLLTYLSKLPIHIHQTELKTAQEVLVAQAKEFFDALIAKNKKEISYELPAQPENILSTILEHNEGVIIGESDHGESSPKKLLIDNMPQLKKSGVTTLFLEHILSDTQQEMLDAYLKSDSLDMPVMLKNYLEYLDTGHRRRLTTDSPVGFLDLVIAAKRHGIRIIAIDTVTSYSTGGELIMDTKKRALMMNYIAARKIAEYQTTKGNEKYIVLCGSMHINSANSGISGLTEITGLPTIVVEDVKLKNEETIKKNPKHIAKPDVLICMQPQHSPSEEALPSKLEKRTTSSPAITITSPQKESQKVLSEQTSVQSKKESQKELPVQPTAVPFSTTPLSDNNTSLLLSEIITILISNIRSGAGGRLTSSSNHHKLKELQTIQDKLNKNDLTQNECITQIMKACEIKRNPLHFWATPTSVIEFKKLLEDNQIELPDVKDAHKHK